MLQIPTMSFLDTDPAAIDRLNAAVSWARFRVTDMRTRLATLQLLLRGDVPITIGAPGGRTVLAAVWSVEGEGGRVHFNVARDALHVEEVVAARVAWAAAYLDDVKLQFELRGLQLSVHDDHRTLHARMPDYMVRLPRRQDTRVRRTDGQSPVLQLASPTGDARAGAPLRVLDISLGGCAVWSPVGGPTLHAGDELRGVEIALDAELRFRADLRVQHLTRHPPPERGLRVGFSWLTLDAQGKSMLRDWIRRGRRRRDLLSLGLD